MTIKSNVSAVIVILIGFLYCTCQSSQTHLDKRFEHLKRGLDSLDNYYQNFINNLGLQEYKDKARWILYLKNAQQSPSCSHEYLLPKNTFLGFLDLKIAYASYKNDTLNILYNFVYNDTLPIAICSRNPKIFKGVGFNVKTQEILGYVVHSGYYRDLDKNGNFLVPTIESSEFLKKNESKLNAWFRSQLLKDKVIY